MRTCFSNTRYLICSIDWISTTRAALSTRSARVSDRTALDERRSFLRASCPRRASSPPGQSEVRPGREVRELAQRIQISEF